MEKKNRVIKTIVSLLLVNILWFRFWGYPIHIYGNENKNINAAVIKAELIDNAIQVSVIPTGLLDRFLNTMNQTQIWGNYGKGWFLIKDYKLKCKNNQSFAWDLKSIDSLNESKAKTEYLQSDSDELKIYVRYNKLLPNKVEELYKTFYLGNPKQDVLLRTSEEANQKYGPVIYDFPVVVTVKKTVNLYLDIPADTPNTYRVKIIGDNGYVEELKKETEKNKKNGNNWMWEPRKVGIFYIAVFDNNSRMVLERKVYVNSSKKENHFDLQDLSVTGEEGQVYVRLTVANTRPETFEGKMEEYLKFTVSEPYVWSRTIKNYGEVVRYNNEKNRYEISEKHDAFTLGAGKYFFNAFIKSPYSVEYEDVITAVYRKEAASAQDFSINYRANGCSLLEGRYTLTKDLRFMFTAKDMGTGYEYAFFLEDARGKRCVQGYSDATTFTWIPADPGTYKIHARVRKKAGAREFPNSYEKEVSETVAIGHMDKLIELQKVKINGTQWNVKSGDTGEGIIKAHELNIIEMEATHKIRDILDADNLMYKVAVVHKGYYYTLGPYTVSPYIPFYPKSPGEYRIMVMVKSSISGSYEDYCEFKVTAK